MTKANIFPQTPRTCPGYGENAGRCGTPLDPPLAGGLCGACGAYRDHDHNIAAEHQQLTRDIKQTQELIDGIGWSFARLAGGELDDLELSTTDVADLRRELAQIAQRLRNVERIHRLHLAHCQAAENPSEGRS